jgi:hypothetical protein
MTDENLKNEILNILLKNFDDTNADYLVAVDDIMILFENERKQQE